VAVGDPLRERARAAAGEHVLVFGKIEGILPQLRQMMGNPGMLSNLEQVCLASPGIDNVRSTTERVWGMLAQRAAAASK